MHHFTTKVSGDPDPQVSGPSQGLNEGDSFSKNRRVGIELKEIIGCMKKLMGFKKHFPYSFQNTNLTLCPEHYLSHHTSLTQL